MSFGWLPKDLSIPRDPAWFGLSHPIDEGMPTRWEEFTFAREIASRRSSGVALDAGSGVTPSQHILPEVLELLGWDVIALDSDPASVKMPASPKLHRVVGDLMQIPLAAASVDAVFCISVLEHLAEDRWPTFTAEAARVSKPGALLVVTADAVSPKRLAETFEAAGFDCGPEEAFSGEQMAPQVAYVVGSRT